MFPAATLEVKVKRDAFDVLLNSDAVWLGSAKGPPRSQKFEVLNGENLHSLVVAAAQKQGMRG